MKKMITASLAAAMVLAAASVSFAAPVELTGDVAAQYRSNTYSVDPDQQGGRFTFHLNAKTALDKNVDLFARFAAQSLSGDKIGADFDTKNGTDDSKVALDQYGFIVKGKDFNYKVGRQGLSISPTALLYSSEGNIGEDKFFLDGVVATGKSGVTDLQLVAGESDKKVTNDRIYSAHASYSPAQDWTVGATLAKSNPDVGSDVNYWGTDVQYATGKANFVADYLKSNANSDNSAFILGVSYGFDEKNSLSVYSHRTNANASAFTDWDPGEKGFYYIYNHNFDKTTALNLFYKDNTEINGTDKNTSFRATVAYKF